MDTQEISRLSMFSSNVSLCVNDHTMLPTDIPLCVHFIQIWQSLYIICYNDFWACWSKSGVCSSNQFCNLSALCFVWAWGKYFGHWASNQQHHHYCEYAASPCQSLGAHTWIDEKDDSFNWCVLVVYETFFGLGRKGWLSLFFHSFALFSPKFITLDIQPTLNHEDKNHHLWADGGYWPSHYWACNPHQQQQESSSHHRCWYFMQWWNSSEWKRTIMHLAEDIDTKNVGFPFFWWSLWFGKEEAPKDYDEGARFIWCYAI